MSWVKRPDLFRVMEKIFPRRLMYGTDFPISYPHRESIEAIEGMDLSEEFRNLLFCDNARRFYKIK
jgi:predicted TIM-barrel fold metal-dependent hydrolase